MVKEAFVFHKNFKNLDAGLTSDYLTDYLTIPTDTQTNQKTITFPLEMPLIQPEDSIKKDTVNIHCEILQRKDNKNWILALHGFASSIRLWDFQKAELLRKGYNIVLFDLLGQGQSTKTKNIKLTAALNSKIIEQIVQETPLKDIKFFLMGVSAGGMIAQDYAVQHQQQIKALILLATSPKCNGVLDFNNQLYKNILLNTSLTEEEKKFYFAEILMMNIFSDSFFRKFKPTIQQLISDFIKRNTVDSMIGSIFTVEGFDITKELPKLKIPVLIFSSSHDKVIETHHSYQLNQLLDNSQRFIFRGVHASHTFVMEMFETFNDTLINELNKIDSFKGSKMPIIIENEFIQEKSTVNLEIHL